MPWERRGTGLRERTGDTCPDTERTLSMATELVRFTQWAREAPQRRYTSLMGMLCDPAGLRQSFERQPGNKAAGVDGMKKAAYGEGVASVIPAASAASPTRSQKRWNSATLRRVRRWYS